MSASGNAPSRGTTGLKLKSGGSTPTMARGTPSMVMACPMIAGSALSNVRHSRALTIAVPSSSGAAAPVRTARPRAGLTPSVVKKFGLTPSECTCSGLSGATISPCLRRAKPTILCSPGCNSGCR